MSETWQKVKYSVDGEYIKGIRRIEAGGALSAATPPTTLFMDDGRILFAGDPSYGNRGNGTGNNLGNLDTTVIDVTSAWNTSLGSVASETIEHFDIRGAIIRNDGIPFVLGLAERSHNDGSPDTYRGFLGAQPDSSLHTGNNHYLKWLSRWKRPNYTPDGISLEPLPQVVSLMKANDEFLFAITADGRLLQPSYFERIAAPNIPTPAKTTYALRELYTPFAYGTPKRLHMGGVLETTSGDLFFSQRKEVQPYLEYMQEFTWHPVGINVNSLGSPVKKIVSYVHRVSTTTWIPTLFILLEDGRLLATGKNIDGWFGDPSITQTAPGELITLHTNVAAFDLNNRSCLVMFNGGSMVASGFNGTNSLGLGAGAPMSVTTWTPCVFT